MGGDRFFLDECVLDVEVELHFHTKPGHAGDQYRAAALQIERFQCRS